MNTLKVFTAFSGYDSQCMALDRLGINYELFGWSEIDKYAIQAHNAVYPQYADRNYGDISKIDWMKVPDFDLFTYSFPCTDISSAGQQKGLTEGSGTRSSLLWECRKSIEIKRPKYLLMENVKALTSEKFLPYLQKWLLFLESMGYSNFTKVLNSKDYGVPQNRERVFCVSIFGDERYYFPKPFKLEKRLKDVLENNVDERYYLSKKMIQCFVNRTEIAKKKGNGFRFQPTDGNVVAKAITTCAMRGRNHDNPSDRTSGIPTEQRIEMGGDVANCLTTVQKDNLLVEPKITEKIDEPLDEDRKRLNDLHVEVDGNVIGIRVNPNSRKLEFNGYKSIKDVSPTLRATDYKCPHTVWLSDKQIEYKGEKLKEGDGLYLGTSKDFFHGGLENVSRTLKAEKHDAGVVQNYRIRKLTPRECFRLMGVSESDIDKIQNAGISKTQQYKMAGNSIVVDVLYHIFRKLFIDKEQESIQLTLF